MFEIKFSENAVWRTEFFFRKDWWKFQNIKLKCFKKLSERFQIYRMKPFRNISKSFSKHFKCLPETFQIVSETFQTEKKFLFGKKTKLKCFGFLVTKISSRCGNEVTVRFRKVLKFYIYNRLHPYYSNVNRIFALEKNKKISTCHFCHQLNVFFGLKHFWNLSERSQADIWNILESFQKAFQNNSNDRLKP